MVRDRQEAEAVTTPLSTCTLGRALLECASEIDPGDATPRSTQRMLNAREAECEGPCSALSVVLGGKDAVLGKYPFGAVMSPYAPEWWPAGPNWRERHPSKIDRHRVPDQIYEATIVGERCERCDEGLVYKPAGPEAWDIEECPACNASGWTYNVCSRHAGMLEPTQCSRHGGLPDTVRVLLSDPAIVVPGDEAVDRIAPGWREKAESNTACACINGVKSPRLSLIELLRVQCECLGARPDDDPCPTCDNADSVPDPALTAALDKAREFGLLTIMESS